MMIRGLLANARLACLAGLVLSTPGCMPDVDPAWLIRRPTELGMRIEVIEQGPWGDRADPDATRTFHDALPGDTLRFEPLIADEDGPIPPEELSGRWALCPTNECLEALATADALLPCDPSLSYTDVETCSLGTDPTATWELGGVPTQIESASIFGLAFGPNVAYVGSRRDGPGADACVAALAERSPLRGCVLMLRDIAIGPVSALLDAAEAIGIEIELSDESLDLLLAEPRNRNPEARRFAVTGSSRTGSDGVEVEHGDAVEVAAGDEIEVTWLSEPDDFDDYTVDLSGEVADVEERVTGRWYLTRPSDSFTPLSTTVHWSVEGPPGRAHLFVVLADDGGSEVWGWLAFDISAD